MKTMLYGCVILMTAAVLGVQAQPRPGRSGGWQGMGGGIGGGSLVWPVFRTPVTGAPYSAVQTVEVQQVLQGGNQIQRETQDKVYRDSQGRVRTEVTGSIPASQPPRTMVTIFDPVAGYIYNLNPQTKIARQMPLRQPNPNAANRPPRTRPNGANTQVTDLGTQTINGVSATGKRTTVTIPAGAIGNQQPIQIVREVWESVDLKVPVRITSSDPRFGTSTMQLTNIVRSEPDPTLFQVPSDYTIQSGPAGRGMRGQMGPRGGWQGR